MTNKYNNQKGFTLVQAVFILVVLGLLGVVMMRMIGVQSSTGVMALQGARAYHAARSGLEWGAAQVLNDEGTGCADIEHEESDDGLLLEGFTVKIVSCDKTTDKIKEGTSEYDVYTIKSQATFGSYGSVDYVSRKVQMKVGDYEKN